jgi:tRNA (guanine37-N1)-methyltransferase
VKIEVITLFPDAVQAMVDAGVTGRAIRAGKVELRTWNPRDLAGDRHRTVDDRPYGGGPGMVQFAQPGRSSTARCQ